MPGKRILPAGRVGCAAQIFAAIYRAKGGGRAATVVEVRQESAMPEIEPSVQTGERKVNKLKRILSLIFFGGPATLGEIVSVFSCYILLILVLIAIIISIH